MRGSIHGKHGGAGASGVSGTAGAPGASGMSGEAGASGGSRGAWGRARSRAVGLSLLVAALLPFLLAAAEAWD
jgi:hypothetical protein